MPQIVPFNFGEEEVNFDDSVMAACSIIKGDLPLKLWWRFTEGDENLSYNLTTNDGVVITRPSQKVTMLTIDAVKARHRGNYTCFAQNKAGTAHFSTYLKVNGSKNYEIMFLFFKNFALVPSYPRIKFYNSIFCFTSFATNCAVQFWRRRSEL